MIDQIKFEIEYRHKIIAALVPLLIGCYIAAITSYINIKEYNLLVVFFLISVLLIFICLIKIIVQFQRNRYLFRKLNELWED